MHYAATAKVVSGCVGAHGGCGAQGGDAALRRRHDDGRGGQGEEVALRAVNAVIIVLGGGKAAHGILCGGAHTEAVVGRHGVPHGFAAVADAHVIDRQTATAYAAVGEAHGSAAVGQHGGAAGRRVGGACEGIGAAGGGRDVGEPQRVGVLPVGTAGTEGVDYHIVLATGSVALAIPEGEGADAVGVGRALDVHVVGREGGRRGRLAISTGGGESHLAIRGPACGQVFKTVGKVDRAAFWVGEGAREHVEGVARCFRHSLPAGGEARGSYVGGL